MGSLPSHSSLQEGDHGDEEAPVATLTTGGERGRETPVQAAAWLETVTWLFCCGPAAGCGPSAWWWCEGWRLENGGAGPGSLLRPRPWRWGRGDTAEPQCLWIPSAPGAVAIALQIMHRLAHRGQTQKKNSRRLPLEPLTPISAKIAVMAAISTTGRELRGSRGGPDRGRGAGRRGRIGPGLAVPSADIQAAACHSFVGFLPASELLRTGEGQGAGVNSGGLSWYCQPISLLSSIVQRHVSPVVVLSRKTATSVLMIWKRAGLGSGAVEGGGVSASR